MKGALIAVGVFAALLVMVLATREGGNVNVGVPRLELGAIDPAVVTSVELAGAQTVTLKKEPSGWTVAGAEKAFHPADDAQVRAALDQLKELKAGDFVSERAEKLGELELDDAKGLRVKVFTSGAAPALELILGKQAKSGGSYLRSPKSSQSFVTQSGLGWAIRRDANGWRKRPFFPAAADQLSKIAVKDGVAVEKSADGKWALTTPAPAGFRFDPAAAERLAGALAGASAVEFLDAPRADPFAGAHTVVEVARKEGAPIVLRLGAPVSAGVPARIDGDPQVYVVAAHAAAALNPTLATMRDTTLLAFDPAKATKLAITAAGKKTVLTKGPDGWKLVEPKTAPEFDAGQVAARLAELQALRGVSVADGVDEKQAGIPKGTTSVEIALEGAPTQTLRLGAATSDGKVYAKGGADALVYVVDSAVRTRWESGLDLFKRLPAPPPGQMQGLENLPPEIRKQLEAQLRQRGQMPQ